MRTLLVQFPTFARKDKFIDCFVKYLTLCSGHHTIHFNINCDVDDDTMNNAETVSQITDLLVQHNMPSYVTLNLYFDKNTDKISAINNHIDGRTFDVVICASDDMVPQVVGWDDIICKDMEEHFPDFNGCLHYNDGYQENKLITLSILGSKLYHKFGYIYHPDYKSLYCDAEFTEQVQKMKAVQYIDKIIIKHEHYGEKGNSNSGDLDLSAKKTLYFSLRDQQVYNSRKSLKYPQERITYD